MLQPKRLWRALLFLVIVAALCGSFAFPVVNTPVLAAPQSQAGSHLVISQVYGAGGNAGATYTNDFVEIFNPTDNAIVMDGWSVQYAPATGTSFTNAANLSGSLLPGQYFLVQLGSNGAVGSALPAPDATGTTNLAAANGKIVLAATTTGLPCNGGAGCAPGDLANIIDLVGYGTADVFEGTGRAPAPSSTTSIVRKLNGCTDTNNNDADFTTALPNPRNKAFGQVAACSTPTLTPSSTSSPTQTSTPTSTSTPTATPTGTGLRSVIINEIAWSGTGASSTDEWFELYNTSGTDINLNGWRLTADDGNPDIALSGTITAADPYFVFARNNAVFKDLVPDKTYSGSFENDGEILYLIDPNGNQIDTANLDGGAWNAGTAAPNYATMERQGNIPDSPSAWSTYGGTVPIAHDRNGSAIKGTPGQSNWILSVTATPTPTQTGTATNTPTRTTTPSPLGYMSILINEVAWMGTGASSNDEWIELYNPGTKAIDITGWTLRAADGTPNITLEGTIAPGGFYLLERTDDDTVIDAKANQIYSGEMENTAEILQLYDATLRLIDTANSNGGNWPAGNQTTFNSMERRGVLVDSDTAWITNVQPTTWKKHDARGTNSTNYLIHGTPGYANWAVSVTPTASPKPTTIVRTPTRTAPPPPPPPLLVINEFVPRPGHDWNHDGVVNVGDEYVEILNHGVVDVNLTGYRLDDEVNIGSDPYALPATVVKPGERVVFYGSETGLLLGDGGDGVRLLKPNGQLMDAYNYNVAGYPDQSYCRLPDNGGADDWNQNCYPTPGLQNSLNGSNGAPPRGGVGGESLCPIADTLPSDFVVAECDPYGNNIWRSHFWDETGWYDEKYLPDIESKWPVFAD